MYGYTGKVHSARTNNLTFRTGDGFEGPAWEAEPCPFVVDAGLYPFKMALE